MNDLLLGDCLDVLPELPAGCAQLIYLDPPYNSGRNYEAFDDRWPSLTDYLDWMRPRLAELQRVLHPDGSIYLHCDPTASHYLKVMMDDILGRPAFKNEIIWHYGKWTNVARMYQRNNDAILFYAQGNYTFRRGYEMTQQKQAALMRGYGSNRMGGVRTLLVYDHHRIPTEVLDSPRWDKIVDLSEAPAGVALGQVWTDIPYLRSNHPERTDYPTQKPLALLERIITVSSNPGDLVLDPMCGSGTALTAAKRLGRQYLGIDRNPNALELTQQRLTDTEPEPPTLFDPPTPAAPERGNQLALGDHQCAKG